MRKLSACNCKMKKAFLSNFSEFSIKIYDIISYSTKTCNTKLSRNQSMIKFKHIYFFILYF